MRARCSARNGCHAANVDLAKVETYGAVLSALPDAAARARGDQDVLQLAGHPAALCEGRVRRCCDSVREMLEAGELTAMFNEKGVAYDKTKTLA